MKKVYIFSIFFAMAAIFFIACRNESKEIFFSDPDNVMEKQITSDTALLREEIFQALDYFYAKTECSPDFQFDINEYFLSRNLSGATCAIKNDTMLTFFEDISPADALRILEEDGYISGYGANLLNDALFADFSDKNIIANLDNSAAMVRSSTLEAAEKEFILSSIYIFKYSYEYFLHQDKKNKCTKCIRRRAQHIFGIAALFSVPTTITCVISFEGNPPLITACVAASAGIYIYMQVCHFCKKQCSGICN